MTICALDCGFAVLLCSSFVLFSVLLSLISFICFLFLFFFCIFDSFSVDRLINLFIVLF